MSFDYNYKFWIATQKDLDDILKRQEVFKKLKPIEDKAVTHYLFAELYARYVQLVNKLGYIYHHTFQVQKRDVIKQLVEASTQRLLELKNELKNLELSEFVYIDKTLVERKLTPDDVTIWTPKYFPYWRPTNVQELIYGPRKLVQESQTDRESFEKADENIKTRENRIEKDPISVKTRKHEEVLTTKQEITIKVQKTTGKPNVRLRERVEQVVDPIKKKLMEAVSLIQSHERARFGRVLLTNIRYNPEVYKPKIRDDERTIRYTFTHKPLQTMLVPVRRTRFEANYYTQKKDIKAFNYYVKPTPLPDKRLFSDDFSGEEDQFSTVSEEIDEPSPSHDDTESELEQTPSLESESEYERESHSESEKNMEKYVENVVNEAAQKIQSFWRGYRDRKKYQALLEKKSLIYGMTQDFKPKSTKTKSYDQRLLEAAKHRLLKEKYDEEFIAFCEDERARILRVRGPWIMEDISDNIRAWFKDFYDKLGSFHPYPDEVKGGTILLVKGETMDVFEYQDKLKEKKLSKEQKKKLREKAKELKKKQKDKIKKEKQAIAKRRAKLKAAGICDMNDEMERSKSIAQIESTIGKYKREWQDIDEKLNRNNEPIKNWITSDFYAEIHQELQLTVDELMRIEYELLQRALAKDLKKKYKAPKKKKPKTKKAKTKRSFRKI